MASGTATIGGFIGSSVGSVVDSWIISSLAPTQRIEGARLDTLRITSATEGAVIPRLYGRMRMGGNIIWATDFREETKTTTQGGGKGGGGGKVKTTEYLYYASFAVALVRGPDHRHRAHLETSIFPVSRCLDPIRVIEVGGGRAC